MLLIEVVRRWGLVVLGVALLAVGIILLVVGLPNLFVEPMFGWTNYTPPRQYNPAEVPQLAVAWMLTSVGALTVAAWLYVTQRARRTGSVGV
ncbi:hypothetical protein [Glaciihabitans sp. dw_435]|uniref:hypothetical protein n=1 Tax=Glaciihabitans sp. dw_435 TaxID=2720081 RepID=UPI001BD5D635|nr:hypothetical protein [Glaciihabitans sp. dw_435]